MRIGAHVSASGGLSAAISAGDSISADVIQFFIGSPRMWKISERPPTERLSFKQAMGEAKTVRGAVTHASYLINLATTDPVLYAKSKSLLLHTVLVANELDLDGVVLHTGSHKGAGMAQVYPQICAAFEEVRDLLTGRTRLFIENTAGAGDTVGSTVDELSLLIDGVSNSEKFGICIDTQHLFASGYALNDEAVAHNLGEDLMARFTSIECVHLNDSKVALGKKTDRHENLGEGFIGREALKGFLSHPVFATASVILEVPGDGKGPRRVDVESARALLGGPWSAQLALG